MTDPYEVGRQVIARIRELEAENARLRNLAEQSRRTIKHSADCYAALAELLGERTVVESDFELPAFQHRVKVEMHVDAGFLRSSQGNRERVIRRIGETIAHAIWLKLVAQTAEHDLQRTAARRALRRLPVPAMLEGEAT